MYVNCLSIVYIVSSHIVVVRDERLVIVVKGIYTDVVHVMFLNRFVLFAVRHIYLTIACHCMCTEWSKENLMNNGDNLVWNSK